LEATSTSSRRAVAENCALWACARGSLTGYILGPALAACRLCPTSRQLVSVLQRARKLGCVPVSLDDPPAAKALAVALSRAGANAEAHIAAGGSVAEVMVARFRFPNLASATGSLEHVGRGRSVHSWPGFYPSESVPFTLPCMGRSRDKSSCSVASDAPALDLRLAWLRDSILVSISTRSTPVASVPSLAYHPPVRRYVDVTGLDARARVQRILRALQTEARVEEFEEDFADEFSEEEEFPERRALAPDMTIARPSGRGGKLVLDIRAVSPELCLILRGLHVEVDAGWLKGHGICSIPKERTAMVQCLAEGLPFVICVRDVLPTETPLARTPMSTAVHALHLEVSRLAGLWL